MSTRLDEAVALLRTLPDDEQDRAANAMIAFAADRADYDLSDEQIAGVEHALAQVTRGEFASDDDIAAVIGGRI